MSCAPIPSSGSPKATVGAFAIDVPPSAAHAGEPKAIREPTTASARTRTGRSPPGVAANQISPRCIAPVGPVLGRTPIGDLFERALRIRRRCELPLLRVVLAVQRDQVPMESIAQQLRAVDAERVRP